MLPSHKLRERLGGRGLSPAFHSGAAPSHQASMTRKLLFSWVSLRQDSCVLALLMALIFLLCQPGSAQALQITLAWDPPATGTPDGYVVFYHLDGQSYDYSHPDWQGSGTACTIPNLQDTTTYFVVRAYNAAGESPDSNEAVYQPAATSSPDISRSPASLSTSCDQGSNASQQSFQVTNSGSGTLSYSISTGGTNWLSCSPTSGTSTGEPDTITVNYSTSGLSAGTYFATIAIAAGGATNSPQTIPVSLTVNAPSSPPFTPPPSSAPAISLSSRSLSASCTEGSDASKQSFQVSNSGNGTLNYSISTGAAWLFCTPTGGTSTGEQDTITVNYSTSGLAAGTYSATITVTDSGATNSPQTVTVNLTVNGTTPTQVTINLWEDAHQDPVLTTFTNAGLLNDHDGLWDEFKYSGRSFPGIFAGHNEWENNGLQPMHFFATGIANGQYEVWANLYTARYTRYFYGFTQAEALAGTRWVDNVQGAGGSSQFAEYSLGTINITDGRFDLWAGDGDVLSGGAYFYGWAWIRLVPVTTAQPRISLNPTLLSRSITQGTNAPSQTFRVSNSGGGTLTYSISTGAAWLFCTPTGGTSTGEQDTITVNYSTSGLAAGTYSATITIIASGASNSPQTIPVSLTVSQAPGSGHGRRHWH
jgi:hypothetical protein